MDISIVVPLFNEEEILPQLLNALTSQTYPAREVILVDACSTDQTRQIILKAAIDFSSIKSIVSDHVLNPGETRNLGFENSAYDWVVFLDAGHFPNSEWLENMAECASTNVDIVFSNRRIVSKKWKFQVFDLLFEPLGEIVNQVHYRNPKVSSMMIRRDAFKKIGVFRNWRSGEDKEFLSRIPNESFRTKNCVNAIVQVQPAASLLSLFRKQELYAWHNSARSTESSHKRIFFYIGTDILGITASSLFFPIYVAPLLIYTQRLIRLMPRIREINNLGQTDFHANFRNWFRGPLISITSDYFVLAGIIRRRLNIKLN